MDDQKLLERITVNPKIFGGKPIIRGRRLAVEHVLAMLSAGETIATILEGYPWLERHDVLACLAYARRLVGHETVEPLLGADSPCSLADLLAKVEERGLHTPSESVAILREDRDAPGRH